MVSLCHIAVCCAGELTECEFSQYGKQNEGNHVAYPKCFDCHGGAPIIVSTGITSEHQKVI